MLKLGFVRFNQSESSTLGKPTNGSPVLKYFLSETIHAQENGSWGTHFAKSLNSNFLKGLTYSAMNENLLPIKSRCGLRTETRVPKCFKLDSKWIKVVIAFQK